MDLWDNISGRLHRIEGHVDETRSQTIYLRNIAHEALAHSANLKGLPEFGMLFAIIGAIVGALNIVILLLILWRVW
jgi:hypothetical protein